MKSFLLVFTLVMVSGTSLCSMNMVDEENQKKSRLIIAIADFNVDGVANALTQSLDLNCPYPLPAELRRRIGTARGGFETPSVSPLYLALKLLKESKGKDSLNSIRLIIKRLLVAGASPNRTFNTTDRVSFPHLNVLPLSLAISENDYPTIEILLKAGGNVLIDAHLPSSILAEALEKNDVTLFELLLNHPRRTWDLCSLRSGVLHHAVGKGLFKHVEQMVAYNVSITDTAGSDTAFDEAMQRGYARKYLDALCRGFLGKKERLKQALERVRAIIQVSDTHSIPPYVLLEILKQDPAEDFRKDLAVLLLQEVKEPNSILNLVPKSRARFLKLLLQHSKVEALKLISQELTQIFGSLEFRRTNLVNCCSFYGRPYEQELEDATGRQAYLTQWLVEIAVKIDNRAREIGRLEE